MTGFSGLLEADGDVPVQRRKSPPAEPGDFCVKCSAEEAAYFMKVPSVICCR